MSINLGSSWKTTLIGILAAVINYFTQLGPNLPQDGKGWGVAFMSAVLFALGAAAKDFNASNAPKPLPAAQAVAPPAPPTS